MYFQQWLAKLSFSERDSVLQQCRIISFKRNDVVLKAGDWSDCVYAVASGLLRVVCPGSGDSEGVTTDFVRRGDVFLGSSLSSSGYISTSTLLAALPSSVYLMPVSKMRDLCVRHPEIAIELLNLSLQRMVSIRVQLRRVAAFEAEAIVRLVLHDLTELAPTEDGGFDRRISQSIIASYSGLSRGMVNKTMKDMEERGLIKKVNEGFLVDPRFASTDFGDPSEIEPRDGKP